MHMNKTFLIGFLFTMLPFVSFAETISNADAHDFQLEFVSVEDVNGNYVYTYLIDTAVDAESGDFTVVRKEIKVLIPDKEILSAEIVVGKTKDYLLSEKQVIYEKLNPGFAGPQTVVQISGEMVDEISNTLQPVEVTPVEPVEPEEPVVVPEEPVTPEEPVPPEGGDVGMILAGAAAVAVLSGAGGAYIITKIVPPVAPSVPVVKEPVYYTEKELYAMNKSQQIALLNAFGAASIPKYEKDRVAKLIELRAAK